MDPPRLGDSNQVDPGGSGWIRRKRLVTYANLGWRCRKRLVTYANLGWRLCKNLEQGLSNKRNHASKARAFRTWWCKTLAIIGPPPTDLQEKAWKVQASRQTSAPSHGVPWMAAHDLCHYSVKTAPFKGEIFRSKLHLRLASRRCNFTSELRLCNLVCFISFFGVFVCTIAAAEVVGAGWE